MGMLRDLYAYLPPGADTASHTRTITPSASQTSTGHVKYPPAETYTALQALLIQLWLAFTNI